MLQDGRIVNGSTLSGWEHKAGRDKEQLSRSGLWPQLRGVTRMFLPLACLLLSILFPACIQTTDCDINIGNCNYFGPEMVNTRLEVVGQESLQQSGVLWLSADDELAVKWDTYRVFWKSTQDTVCDFPNVLPTEERHCQRCNYCADQWVDPMQPETETDSVNCSLYSFGSSANSVVGTTVISYKGTMMGAGPEVIAQAGYLDGCPGAPLPTTFKPRGNSTLRILAPQIASYHTDRNDLEKRAVPVESLGDFGQSSPVFVSTAQVEKKVHVINETPQQATHQMQLHEAAPAGCTQAANANCVVWHRWSVGTTTDNGRIIWDVNFSNNLRIGKIRVLRIGRTDPNNPRRVISEEPTVVRPSRIVFIGNFDPSRDTVLGRDAQRCYAGTPPPNTPDGNIELTRCRQTSDRPAPAEFVYTATPTLFDGAQLTWFAEFKLSENSDADLNTPCDPTAMAPNPTGCDPLDPTAVLAIEFTIERA